MSDHFPTIFCYPFTAQCHITIPGAVHQLGTQALMITVLDTQVPPQPVWWALDPEHPPVAPDTYDVTLTFLTPQSGRVLLRAMYL